MKCDAGDARHGRNTGRRDARHPPAMNRAAANAEGAPQLRGAAGHADGALRNLRQIVGAVAHGPQTVQSHCTALQVHFWTARSAGMRHHQGMERPILSLSDHRVVVGQRLSLALDAAGLEQVQAADIMGVSKQSMTEYVKGRGYPPQYGCYKLHKMTGITYDWLFLGDWSALPARLAAKLAPDLSTSLAGSAAPVRLEAETDA